MTYQWVQTRYFPLNRPDSEVTNFSLESQVSSLLLQRVGWLHRHPHIGFCQTKQRESEGEKLYRIYVYHTCDSYKIAFMTGQLFRAFCCELMLHRMRWFSGHDQVKC